MGCLFESERRSAELTLSCGEVRCIGCGPSFTGNEVPGNFHHSTAGPRGSCWGPSQDGPQPRGCGSATGASPSEPACSCPVASAKDSASDTSRCHTIESLGRDGGDFPAKRLKRGEVNREPAAPSPPGLCKSRQATGLPEPSASRSPTRGNCGRLTHLPRVFGV